MGNCQPCGGELFGYDRREASIPAPGCRWSQLPWLRPTGQHPLLLGQLGGARRKPAELLWICLEQQHLIKPIQLRTYATDSDGDVVGRWISVGEHLGGTLAVTFFAQFSFLVFAAASDGTSSSHLGGVFFCEAEWISHASNATAGRRGDQGLGKGRIRSRH